MTIFSQTASENKKAWEGHKKGKKIYRNSLHRFKKIAIYHLCFKFFFLLLFLFQLITLAATLQRSTYSALLAIHIGILFFTIFTFFVLFFYFQGKKTQQLLQIKTQFIDSCRLSSLQPIGYAEHHLSIAEHLFQLSMHLHSLEYRFYSPSKSFSFLSPLLKKLGKTFHHQDVFFMKEILYLAAVEEHISQIRLTPTDLEVHGSLANVYVELAKLYLGRANFFRKRKRKERRKELLYHEKFSFAASQAIEELHILNIYAPNNPWVHAKLAQSYHDLEMFEEEAKEYETLLEIQPQDKKVRFELAKLYFQLGKNAEALKLYQQLLDEEYSEAGALLKFYHSAQLSHLHEEL